MEDTKNLSAAELDKQAIERAFILCFDQHVKDELHGKAPTWVIQKLQSEKFIDQWSQELSKLCTRITEPRMKRKLTEKRIEVAQLRQRVKQAAASLVNINDRVKLITGLEVKGDTFQEAQLAILGLILQELKEIRSAVSFRPPVTYGSSHKSEPLDYIGPGLLNEVQSQA